MQLTVRAGSFTSTGEAKTVLAERVVTVKGRAFLDGLIAGGKAEMMPDGRRVRVWLQNGDGALVERSKTFTLPADKLVDLLSDPLRPVLYDIDLVSDGTLVDVAARRRVLGIDTELDPLPPGWRKVHEIVYSFVVPAAATDIAPVDIYCLCVLPGFPPEGPNDWLG